MRADIYQTVLIILSAIAAVLGGLFVYNEIFPEYKIFQNDFIALEEFRSTYSGEASAPFKVGVKQIVLTRSDKGPEVIDRCTSCHVALDIPHFSPTKIAYDLNGNVVVDTEGNPVKVPNEDYIWKKLDDRISELTDAAFNQKLAQEGKESTVKSRLAQAEKLKAMKTAQVEGREVDMTKALAMHPLIGRETRPFEFHPVDHYGCTACHNGNGRGLVMDKAHGPVFDGQYTQEFEGNKLHFLEKDEHNDPHFSKAYNGKPDHELLFQTTPLFIGGLIEAKCVLCHKPTASAVEGIFNQVSTLTGKKEEQIAAIKEGMLNDAKALIELVQLKKAIVTQGVQPTLASLEKKTVDYSLPPDELKAAIAQVSYMKRIIGTDSKMNQANQQQEIVTALDQGMVQLVGSVEMGESLSQLFVNKKFIEQNSETQVQELLTFYAEQKGAGGGSLFAKAAILNLQQELIQHVKNAQTSFQDTVGDATTISAISSDVDALIKTYHKGEGLFISQGCYACHRIAAFSRGGVGPELTNESKAYPWFVKQKLAWPQADLKNSTMPNMSLDHDEIEALSTFVLSQSSEAKALSPIEYRVNVKEWEAGRRTPLEEPLSPDKIHDTRNSMLIFAIEGCAGCHRLKGFDSNVGYRAEASEAPDFEAVYQDHLWFTLLFPEEIIGSQIVERANKNRAELDRHLADNVRQNGLLEEIEKKAPGTLEATNSNFKFALRAKDHEYAVKIAAEKDPAKKQTLAKELEDWKSLVKQIMMIYYQEYGFGRMIGPKLNWSGVFRSDEWLMNHFVNPTSTSPKSLMPAFPFDQTKFYALTFMLDALGKKNSEALHTLWEHRGFNPGHAYDFLCSQCHGGHLHGSGPISQWIYPIPKNLNDAAFLRNLTKEEAISSITHGVMGTPMPPWGEVAAGKQASDVKPVLTTLQIKQLVDWMYYKLAGEQVIENKNDVLKWQYTPQDVIQEMHHERDKLKSDEEQAKDRFGVFSKKDGFYEAIAKNFACKSLFCEAFGVRCSHRFCSATLGKQYLPCLTFALFKYVQKSGGCTALQRLRVENNTLAMTSYASLTPVPSYTPVKDDVGEIFNIDSPFFNGGPPTYYIKKKYYTAENLDAGRTLFIANCSICHGKDADGTGLRAESMTDAKPRMLVNLNWLNTRDDLRLLRCIKYGVPGTSMIPWGDQTSSLQRMQMVMFIRSLSLQTKRQQELKNALYHSFERDEELVNLARSQEYAQVDHIQKEIRQSHAAREKLAATDEKTAVANYQKELDLKKQLQGLQAIDQRYLDLKNEIEKEKGYFLEIGKELILRDVSDQELKSYLELIDLHQGWFVYENGHLELHQEAATQKKIEERETQLLKMITVKIDALNEEKEKIKTQSPSDQLQKVKTDLAAYNKLKTKMISNFSQAQRSELEQMKIYGEINQPAKQ